MFRIVRHLPVGLICAGILFASQIGPSDVRSNLSKWADKLGLLTPDWLQSPVADTVVTWTALGVFVVYVFGTWWWSHRTERKLTGKPVTAATSVEELRLLVEYTKQKRLQHKQNLRELELKGRAAAAPVPAPASDSLKELPEAARELYEAARERYKVLAMAAEQLGSGGPEAATAEEILDYMAVYMVTVGADIFGARPPSAKRELIDRDEANVGSFEDGALVFKTDRNAYSDLAIRRKDFADILLNLGKDKAPTKT